MAAEGVDTSMVQKDSPAPQGEDKKENKPQAPKPQPKEDKAKQDDPQMQMLEDLKKLVEDTNQAVNKALGVKSIGDYAEAGLNKIGQGFKGLGGGKKDDDEKDEKSSKQTDDKDQKSESKSESKGKTGDWMEDEDDYGLRDLFKEDDSPMDTVTSPTSMGNNQALNMGQGAGSSADASQVAKVAADNPEVAEVAIAAG
ncbi:Uncharacterised protein [Legionella lansingensis]|uniref:Uncharacterized protein n=1 Tax=Legionella lansingensis TaxID=45067 RepID=A0A0W0VRC3_9GAMM|nr:hypothetical protein [Legionella lansingensis]KTD22731.1 hypothetical protein Llan_1082 [Legionella lansingensis]SNV56686.1 Uncharacterised protein [Legionella lansingensis]